MKLRNQTLIAFVVVAAVVLAWPLLADVCRRAPGNGLSQVPGRRVVAPVYSYGHHYASPVALRQVYAPYYYAVGSELQLDAIAERLSQRIEQKLLEKQRAAMPPAAHPAAKLVSASCAKCHSPGTKAVLEESAPIYFDAEGRLTATAEQRASMKTAAHLGAMPPAKELSDDDYLSLVRELERAE